MKINFDNFQMQKWVSETVRAQEAEEKYGTICLIFMTLSGVMVLNGQRFTLLENGIGIMLWIIV